MVWKKEWSLNALQPFWLNQLELPFSETKSQRRLESANENLALGWYLLRGCLGIHVRMF